MLLATCLTTCLATCLTTSLMMGCGTKADHPPMAGGCPADASCVGVGGPPGGGPHPDTGTVTDGRVADSDGGEVGVVDIRAGEARNVASFTQNPATGSLDTIANQFVRGAQGAKFLEVPVIGGTFSLGALDTTFPINFLYLDSHATPPSVTRTVFGFPVDAVGGAYDVQIPSFPDNLSQTFALGLGVPHTSGSTRGTATIVLQVLDDAGAARRGVIGLATPTAPQPPGTNANPYYDDSSDGLVASASGTGARGTIVWLAVVPGAFPVKFQLGTPTKTFAFTAPAQADAVTFVRMRVTP